MDFFPSQFRFALRWLGATLLLAAPILICACGRSSEATGTAATTAPSPAAAAPVAPGVVRIGYFANLTHAQAVLGVADGEFAQAVQPAKLETRVFNAGPSLVEALFANEIDIGYVGPGPALTAYARSHGESIRVIAGAAANGVLIVAGPNSGIQSMADLVGKRLATPQLGNTQDIAARHYLQHELHQTDLTKVVPVPNSEAAGMLQRGQIDAAWEPEPWGSLLIQQAGAKLIAEEKDLWPDHQFALTVVVTTPSFISAHPDVIAHILAVHKELTRKLSESAASCVPQLSAALAALSGKAMSPDLLTSSLTHTQFLTDPLPATFDTMSQWSADLNFVQPTVPLAGLFDTRILKSLP
jgi:NitT/TauT family transport system substrate-binding protein